LHPAKANPVDAHRPRYVLEALVAHIVEGEVEPAGGVLLNTGRHANPAWIGKRFKPGGDIHPSPKMSSPSTTTSPW